MSGIVILDIRISSQKPCHRFKLGSNGSYNIYYCYSHNLRMERGCLILILDTIFCVIKNV
jgi:hypothetical protein